MGKKRQDADGTDQTEQLMRRMQANLSYFQKNHPAVYQMLATINLENVELVVTPGQNDVDMIAYGKSCYRGLAREFSLDEAKGVLRENPEERRIQTFAPPSADNYRKKTFVNRLLQDTILASPIGGRAFTGYIRGNFFPSIVFLGVGLGYHVDWLTKNAPIINGIVIEREPEKFAVSLYTVDWAAICSRFARKGRSLTFAIGKADSQEEVRELVSRSMTKDVPFYPFFSTYYNHLADVEIARGVLDTAKDLSVVSTNWIDYDNELIRLKNTSHNFNAGGAYVARAPGKVINKPVIVVGSGPSIDKRIDDIKKIRDQVTVISAGTGLGGLLGAGIIPDFQVELDPGHVVYRFHSAFDQELLKQITLLAVNEVNPKVPTLFGDTFYFFKFDNGLPYALGLEKSTFNGCNPTVTNAALAISHAMGVREVYLFGTDYGFESEDHDHADHSIYGRKNESDIAQRMRENAKNPAKSINRKKTFEVPAVNGGTVLTRGDYYSAKRSVEDLIHSLKAGNRPFDVFNCAEGAVIAGVEWLPSEDLQARFDCLGEVAGSTGFDHDMIKEVSETLPESLLEQVLPGIHRELSRMCNQFERLLRSARLNGRRDLCEVVNEIRQQVSEIRPPKGEAASRAFVYAHQLLSGSVKHFLYVGLCHGMACENKELNAFLQKWKENFKAFLVELPAHFERVMFSELPVSEDPWALRTLYNPDPEFTGDMPLDSRGAK